MDARANDYLPKLLRPFLFRFVEPAADLTITDITICQRIS
ncbi:hypothetical protein I546_1203 [Mycobacterium kansasii 732]|nr:hypothetical protein I546_1203 [Mycobacterium kansasii 732]